MRQSKVTQFLHGCVLDRNTFRLGGDSGISRSTIYLAYPRRTGKGIHNGMAATSASDDKHRHIFRQFYLYSLDHFFKDCRPAFRTGLHLTYYLHKGSVFEVAHSCKQHGDSGLVGLGDGIVVTDASARLDNGLHPIFCCEGHAVIEREKAV